MNSNSVKKAQIPAPKCHFSARSARRRAALRRREKKAVGLQRGDPADMSAKQHNASLVNIQPRKKREKFMSRQLGPGIGRPRT